MSAEPEPIEEVVEEPPDLSPPLRAAILAFLGLFVAQQLLGGIAFAVSGDIETNELFYSPSYMLAGIVADAIAVAIALYVCRPWAAPRLGLIRPPDLGRALGTAVATVLGGIVISVALEYVLHGGEAQGLQPEAFPGGTEALIGVALAALAVTVAAPVAEEIIFRGALFGSLRGRIGTIGAALASSAAFGAIHLVPEAFPALMLLGLLLVWAYVRGGSLLVPIGVHGFYNGAALAAALAAT